MASSRPCLMILPRVFQLYPLQIPIKNPCKSWVLPIYPYKSQLYPHIYIYIYISPYIYIYVCMYVCMYPCMYVSMYVCMYVSMYVCMYVCIYIYCIYPSKSWLIFGMSNSSNHRDFITKLSQFTGHIPIILSLENP